MYFFTASLARTNGEVIRRRVAADSVADARTIAWRIADELGDVTSVEVWQY